MSREYFITTPLIFAPKCFMYKNCTIHFRGSEARSFIEGPSSQAIDEAFEIISAIQHCAHIPGLRVHLRGISEKQTFPSDPRNIKGNDWNNWAFSQVPLKTIPLIVLDISDCVAIQKELDSYEKAYTDVDE